jgi:uncharacterized membrane protein YedE/YeeE
MIYEHAVIGGLMIGTAALLMYAMLGRIAGVSGILYGLLWQSGDRVWRLAFIAGLIAGPWILVLAGWASPIQNTSGSVSVALIPLSGLLVGIGTRMGNGCTSGHGVCGIARLSPRSFIAVVTFMAAGIITATFIRPLIA